MGFFGVKKRHPYPSTQPSNGDKAIIEKDIFMPGLGWVTNSLRALVNGKERRLFKGAEVLLIF